MQEYNSIDKVSVSYMMSTQTYVDNFCLVDLTKAIKDDKVLLETFLKCRDFSSRLRALEPLLHKQFDGFRFTTLWPYDSDRKDNSRSELYRTAGNKAFSIKDSRQV